MMRLLLSFIMFILSNSVFGQMQKVATFDFTDPSYLGLPSDDNTSLNTKTLTLGKITMNFSRGEATFGIHYEKINNQFFLRMYRGSRLSINGNGDTTIKNVTFDYENFGDLNVVDEKTGTWDTDHAIWVCGDNDNVNNVEFKNNGDHSLIKKITVTYSEPINVLEPTVESSMLHVNSFKSLALNFTSKMTKVGTQSLAISGNDNTYPLNIDINNSTVNLSLSDAISVDGTYTINIPAGYFQDTEGYRNKALTYNIVVSTPKNTLNYVSVNPTTNEIEQLNSPITLTYDTYLKSFSKKLMMQKDGKDFAYVNLEKSTTNYKEVNITFVDIPNVITDKGIYTINVPEGVIYDNLEKVYNPEFTLTYKVGYKPAPVYSETMKTAIALVEKTGVGYPTSDSDCRKTLVALTTAEEVPSDETLQPAIEAFYKETNVEMPAEGKWYYISNINSEKTPLYITVKDGIVGVTDNKAKATAFEMYNPTAFKTKDGKFLYTASTEDNSEGKDLKLEKLLITNIDAKDLLGCFSIYGFYETTKTGVALNAYASVNHDEKTISTDDHDATPMFNETYSGAFVLTETTQPSDEPVSVDMHCQVSPETITNENVTTLTLSFSDSEIINVTDNAEAKLCTENGDEILSLALTANSKQSNAYTVKVGNLQNAKYQIKIPAGVLSYTNNGINYVNKELKVFFEVNKETVTPEPTEDFDYSYSGILYYPTSEYIKDVDLNNFTIGNAHYNYPDEEPQGLIVDETKEVILMQLDLAKEIRRGHFKKISSIPTDPDSPEAYQIVFDTPIKEGDLKDDTYTFIFPKATFGDYNFGEYLKDASSISPKLCHVNSEYRLPFKVNKDKATGIKEITSGSNKQTVIYDLMGRRVQNMNRPGIYIVNGKKVIKK